MSHTQRTLRKILLSTALLLASHWAFSAPMDQWESWILESHPQQNCPWLMGKNNAKSCIWPGKLSVSANDRGGSFSQTLDIYEKRALVALPGSSDHWPTSVAVDGKPAEIIERNNRPYVALTAGNHTVTGDFSWSKRPRQLAVPGDIAIIALKVNGKDRAVDRRNGQLIFSRKSEVAQVKSNESLGIEVFRLVSDGVPVTMVTHLALSVSGKPREVTFGSVMLAGTALTHLQSNIPARIEADGSMRAQVSPGEYSIKVFSRFVESPDAIATRKLTQEWPESEYLSFQSATSIRQVKLSGPVSIDTTQISIPQEWAEYPTYRMVEGESLNIETEFRGDYAPAANQMNVKRDLWLDFSGDGITSLDRIGGRMNKDWRINAAARTNIGRATVDQAPVLITVDQGVEGIEVRSPAIQLEAVTRTESTSGFSASGWDTRADQYSATLHLPPGWRVLHASGIDGVWGTWLSKWDLWDVFLVLIIVSATRKLIGNRVALLAGAAFVIALHETGTPLLIIPVLLLQIALLPVVSGKIKSMLRAVGVLFAASLALSVIAFAVSTFRVAIYPSLERAQIGTYSNNYYDQSRLEEAQMEAAAAQDASIMKRATKSMPSSTVKELVVTAQKREKNLYQVTENDRVQTGPGLPTWIWSSVVFESSSPVPATQNLSIYYSTPMATTIWRVLSVFLVAFYAGIVVLRFARLSQFKTEDAASSGSGSAALSGLGLVLLMGVFNVTDAMAQDYPPKYLMDQLEARLTKAPICLPDCASLNDGQISVRGTDITIAFSAYADADVVLPLPGGHGSWMMDSVSEEGVSLPLKRSQNNVFTRLTKGHHELLIKGRMTAEQVAINLPLAIHNLKVIAPGWVVEGLVNGRARNGTITMRALDKNAAKETDTLKADPAPAFVQVNRHFAFGKKWNIQTTVQRVAPHRGAISIPVKLVGNEKLLKDMGVVKDQAIVVQLGHGQQRVSWSSTLEPTEQLRLNAAGGADYIEQWSFTPSSLWRLTYDGIPPVKAQEHNYAFEPVFKPWPGESLVVGVRKPVGVPGDTHTVESAVLTVDAGDKLQLSTLALEIRASLGTNYSLTLPEDAEVLRFSIDGRAMNTPAANRVKVPLQPGSQSVLIEFQTLADMGLVSRSPEIILPDGATNITVQYTLPRDRWPLYLNGPAIGPAMLFWGVLCVIVLGALALPRLASATQLEMPITLIGWLLLGIGLSTVNSYGVLIIAVMFFLLAARKQLVEPEVLSRFQFNLLQCFIVAWVVLAVLCMIAAIPMGLLSNPEMKVVGNGSGSHFYNYYQDIAGEVIGFPSVTVISVPMLAYRAVMLLWSLWLSTRLIQWAAWAWACYTEKGSWKPKPVPSKKTPASESKGAEPGKSHGI
ncbi:MAG: hypothetical protein AB8B81_21185 [Halioglobus sp.]